MTQAHNGMAFKPAKEKTLNNTNRESQSLPQEADLNVEREIDATREQSESRDLEHSSAQDTTEQKPTAAIKKRPALPPPAKDEVVIKIEKILEEGLNDSFQRLSPVAKQEFKLKGEQTAIQIRDLLKNTHVKVKKILRLILDWLRMLPGINHFFLEQEAKIKTDKIIFLKNKV